MNRAMRRQNGHHSNGNVPILGQSPVQDVRLQRVKWVIFTPQLITWLITKGAYTCDGLDVPEGTIVLGTAVSQNPPTLSLVLHHPSFPVVLAGVSPPMINVQFHRVQEDEDATPSGDSPTEL